MAWIKRPKSMPWRDITSSMTGITSGRLLVMRDGGTVWLDFQDLVAEPQGTTYVLWNRVLTAGLRPNQPFIDLPLPQRTSADTSGPLRVDRYGGITVYRHTGTIRAHVAFHTDEAMPASGDWPGAAL